jgi:hypothetical protein
VACHACPPTGRRTAYTPEGAPDTYSLVSEEERAADPARARQIDTRWSAVVGAGTTLSQVLEAKRSGSRRPAERREVLARFMAGAAFVLLEELPSADEMAFGALAGGWQPIHDDLLRLDGVVTWTWVSRGSAQRGSNRRRPGQGPTASSARRRITTRGSFG